MIYFLGNVSLFIIRLKAKKNKRIIEKGKEEN